MTANDYLRMGEKWMSQTLRFLRRFISAPQAIGSIVPSSPALVDAMLEKIVWSRVNTVAELGGGTGVITAQINGLRSQDSRFLCFENDSDMHLDLQQKFSDVILEEDAIQLKHTLERHRIPGLDCVVSGLPLLNFSSTVRRRLLSDIHESLNPGGLFVAFQYTRQLQAFLLSTYDQIERHYVWANVPPAFVFLCRK
ncbi:hypothetical protein [Marinobacter sp. ATCH36]|uniref:class I SAM-dependent methyltransferase n=1 Tax=Marinobacter sp. ATCH36 TaxID=2945106 RepID=UPI0020228F47|nr:hypothetical protein [Marinobacter sp. ATCH36]MCL7944221.1 hypothetical protein [Marinobacter sp. ATCH36]